jgi:GTP-binding protein
VERTRVLIHLVDVFGYDGHSAAQNFRMLNKELKAHSKRLAATSQIVAATKMDLTGAEEALRAFRRALRKEKIYPISSATGKGLKDLLAAVAKALEKAPASDRFAAEPVDIVIEPDFAVEPAGENRWRVLGKKIARLVAVTNFDQDEALSRFQNILTKIGIDQALEKEGAHPGDMVEVGDREFIYRPEAKKR